MPIELLNKIHTEAEGDYINKELFITPSDVIYIEPSETGLYSIKEYLESNVSKETEKSYSKEKIVNYILRDLKTLFELEEEERKESQRKEIFNSKEYKALLKRYDNLNTENEELKRGMKKLKDETNNLIHKNNTLIRENMQIKEGFQIINEANISKERKAEDKLASILGSSDLAGLIIRSMVSSGFGKNI